MTKSGYINIRESPKVLNGYIINNLIGKFTGKNIGTIKSETMGEDGYVWYLVKLDRPIDGKSEGYVREDVINIA